MEALNDIGASEFLGVRTMTVSVYTTWIARSDLAGAAQLALAMLAVVIGLVLLERWGRRQRRYNLDAQDPRPLTPQRLTGLRALTALGMGLVPIAIGFIVPASYLSVAAARRVSFAGVSDAIAREALNTLTVSLLAAALTLAAAVAVVYAARIDRGRLPAACARVASLGYAVPGTVLAIGILPIVIGFDGLIDSAATRWLGVPTGLLVLGSGGALVYAYLARFLAVAAGSVEAGFSRVPPSLDDAARTMGRTPAARLWHVHLPLTRPPWRPPRCSSSSTA